MYPSSTTWTSGCIHPGITELDEVFIEPLKTISWTSAFYGVPFTHHRSSRRILDVEKSLYWDVPLQKIRQQGSIAIRWKVSSLRFWYVFQLWQNMTKLSCLGSLLSAALPISMGFGTWADWCSIWKKIIHPPSENNNNNLRQSDGILSIPGKLLASRNLTWNLKINETITHYQEEKHLPKLHFWGSKC